MKGTGEREKQREQGGEKESERIIVNGTHLLALSCMFPGLAADETCNQSIYVLVTRNRTRALWSEGQHSNQ